MATKKKTTRQANPSRICVLATEDGENLILRSDPTVREVRKFVRIHHTRNPADFPNPTYRIMSATFYESEIEYLENLDLEGEEVKISDI